jgi:hypothetical protein
MSELSAYCNAALLHLIRLESGESAQIKHIQALSAVEKVNVRLRPPAWWGTEKIHTNSKRSNRRVLV